LFRKGPLVDLAGQAIITLAKEWSDRLQVFVFGVGSDCNESGLPHPPLTELWEHFTPDFRICMDPKQASAGDKLKLFRAAKLDVFISLPGWTGSEDLGLILHCRAAPVQFNWLEFASVMYAPRLVDWTILGQAVGTEQRNCQTRERLAEIASPGTYQPVQSLTLLHAVQSRPVKKDRAHWGLPADNFILFVAGTTNRLDFMRYPAHPLWEMARRIPRGIVLFLDKPEGSQSYILRPWDIRGDAEQPFARLVQCLSTQAPAMLSLCAFRISHAAIQPEQCSNAWRQRLLLPQGSSRSA